MRISRLYIDTPLQTGNCITLDGETLNYVSRVLRLKPGHEVTLFNGQGGEYTAIIKELHKRGGLIEIGQFRDIDLESTLDITLVQGISRGERMDLTLQKATELGVKRIMPVFSDHCTVNLTGERLAKRHAHWQGIIRSACEQSGRNRLPELKPAIRLSDHLQQTPETLCLLLDPEANNSLKDLQDPYGHVHILIGPEGGFSSHERETAYSKGYQGAHLGPRVLRTETSAITAIGVIQLLWGDF